MKKVSFLDFWYDFDIANNFFSHLLGKYIRIVPPYDADMIIYSCFGNENRKYPNIKKIFYTGESITPDYTQCDFSFSFEKDDPTNIRIPLWLLYIDWFGVKTYGNPNWLIPINYLMGDNEFTVKEKRHFCCTVFSSPYDLRFEMINKLNAYKKIDCYGKIHEFKIGEGEKIKMDIISDYKFNICFENKNKMGYYTEKLLHAKIAGNIPIYYSNGNYYEDFNKKCCINLCDYNSVDDMVEYIIKIDNNSEYITKEPLFDKIPDINEIKIKILDRLFL